MRTTPHALTLTVLTAALLGMLPAAAHASAPGPDPTATQAPVGHIVPQPTMDAELIALDAAALTAEPQTSAPVVARLSPGVRYAGSPSAITDQATGMRYHAVRVNAETWGWAHEGVVAVAFAAPRVLDRIAIKPELHSSGGGVGLTDAVVTVMTQSAGVRAYPNGNAPVLGEIEPGEAVLTSDTTVEGVITGLAAGASGETSKFRYVRVVGRDLEGWVMEGRIHMLPERDDLLVGARSRTPAGTIEVRDVPASVGSKVVATILAGTSVDVGATYVDGWTPVEVDGEVGWVLAQELSAGAVDPSATPSPSTWQGIKDGAKKVVDEGRGWVDSQHDKAEAGRGQAADRLDPMRPVRRAAGPVLTVAAVLIGTLLWLRRRGREVIVDGDDQASAGDALIVDGDH